MTDFEKLTDFSNMYAAYQKSLSGHRNSKRTVNFQYSALDNIILMVDDLRNKRYVLSPYQKYWITEPKPRMLQVGSFRDKVLERCLCDYVILPKMKTVFIRNNFAGQTGKGTLFALNTLSSQLEEYYQQFGDDGFILKCDISGFYYNITHDSVKRRIRNHFSDSEILRICDQIIDSTPGEVGLPLGNPTSQDFALILLHDLDVMITSALGFEMYGRYVDDFYLIHHDREFLQDCLTRIEEHLMAIGLHLNQKTQIVPIRKGIRFLGFHTYLTADGKVIRKLTGDNKRKEKKRLRKDIMLVSKGKMTVKKMNEKYGSWRNHASHGNCFKLIQSMDQYKEQLMIEYGIEEAIGCT